MRILFVLLMIVSCGEKQKLEFFELEKKDFDPIINESTPTEKPDLGSLKTILNRDYPIEIAIFENGKWYYDLPNLGDGFGTWQYENGRIKLNASRHIFDMKIDVVGLSEDANKMGVKFSDRFGPQTLTVEKITPNK